MSLTSMLDDPRSPLRGFLAVELAQVAEVRTSYHAQRPRVEVLRPSTSAGPVPWAVIGTAVDLRLRLSFAAPALANGAVGNGVQIIGTLAGPAQRRGRHQAAEALVALSTAGHQLIEEVASVATGCGMARRDTPMLHEEATERLLARLCVVAAWFEAIFRAGPQVLANSPLRHPGPEVTLKRLLDLVPDPIVDDIVGQVRLAASGPLEALRQSSPAVSTVVGPVFVGSTDVGGADADLIAAGTLVDVKCTIRPESLPLGTVYQLAGYLLLDYADAYRIERLGIYLSRIGALLTWPVPDFLTLLGAKRPLPQLRAACTRLLQTGDPR